jgi:Lon protease-like protein
MSERPFHPRYEDLPQALPLFPLPGVLLLPAGRLPLNIFERRYLAMIEDALCQPGRLVGMIQPSGPPPTDDDEPPLYATGCAGRISAFAETDDGRIALTLTGVCRFRLAGENPPRRGYRRGLVDWEPFRADLDEPPSSLMLERERLLAVLKAYVRLHNMEVNWKTVDAARSNPAKSRPCWNAPMPSGGPISSSRCWKWRWPASSAARGRSANNRAANNRAASGEKERNDDRTHSGGGPQTAGNPGLPHDQGASFL